MQYDHFLRIKFHIYSFYFLTQDDKESFAIDWRSGTNVINPFTSIIYEYS